MDRVNIELQFETSGEPIDSKELADFILLFRAIYVFGVINYGEYKPRDILKSKTQLIDEIHTKISKLNNQKINELFAAELGDNKLLTPDIRKSNPLEIVFGGLAVALVIAVIISGGEIQIMFAKAKCNPLGDGIKKIREALEIKKEREIGYEIRNLIIVLNRDEYNELLKQGIETRKRGGYQRLLVGLQFRIDRQTRTLLLTDNDLDKIHRYGQGPEKGGWQSRIRKIFGRHIDFE